MKVPFLGFRHLCSPTSQILKVTALLRQNKHMMSFTHLKSKISYVWQLLQAEKLSRELRNVLLRTGSPLLSFSSLIVPGEPISFCCRTFFHVLHVASLVRRIPVRIQRLTSFYSRTACCRSYITAALCSQSLMFFIVCGYYEQNYYEVASFLTHKYPDVECLT
jgi:hypothetical protein